MDNQRYRELMRNLAAADFYAQDLKLYLDTHPEDKRAVEIYREAVRQTDTLRKAFENEFYPLRASSAGKNDEWNWLMGQWIM